MKTLRDERARLFGPSHPANETYSPAVGPHFDMEHRFFAKYGSWRVGEGELVWAGVYRGEQMKRLRDRVCVEVSDESGSHYVHIGRIGDNVKFILPPEEKVGGPNWEVRCKNERELKRIHRARADKFEKALRENVERGRCYGFCPVNDYQRGAKAVAETVAAEAREALDDTDS